MSAPVPAAERCRYDCRTFPRSRATPTRSTGLPFPSSRDCHEPGTVREPRGDRRDPELRRGLLGTGVLLLAGLVVLAGVAVWQNARRDAPGRFVATTPYQAILLTNGQAYFGKLEQADSAYAVLTDVFYVQTQVHPETKQVSNTLVKRGKEWHAFDRMILNARHILFLEPVAEDSTVARLIAELKKRE